ncbi:hypothetical protein [Microbacterium sp. T32]|nr:hypothetical protein [Microbacterium sp. T32]KZE42750.1 hypothetical protein AVW09_08920 [Microbacterium sp. T32]
MASDPLLIDLPGVARLAGVRRAVPSMWRKRFRGEPDPFPPVRTEKNGRPYFDALSVAQWLARTSHGNNPSAVADAAASAAPAGFEIADPAHVATIDALLTLSALTGETLAGRSSDDLRALARSSDADDLLLASEIVGASAAWAAWADLLADAAYSPLEASILLERRHAATRSSAGSAGPLAPEAEDFLVTLGTALLPARDAILTVTPGMSPSLTVRLMAPSGEHELGLPDHPESRAVRRRMVLEGMPVPEGSTRVGAARLTILRLPSPEHRFSADMLDAVNEVTLGMRDDDRAVVLGPAAVLIGPLPAAEDLVRADALRTGRVRAIARLPRGLVTSAVREPLAVWVMGRETGDVPVAERFTAVADLTDASWTTAARQDLVSDVVAAMGGARDVRAHAFRFTGLVRTTSLLASREGLVASAVRSVSAPERREIPALLDQARAAMVDPVPATVPAERTRPGPDVGAIETMIDEGHLRVLPGTRMEPDEFTTAGLVVVTADDLDDTAAIGGRRVDQIAFAQRHPNARLTLPGDVVFRTSPTPRAWVDREGSSVVVHPARVLRISSADPGGLVPHLVAVDIARATGDPGAWRRWRLRRVAPSSTRTLDRALADIAARRLALAQRMDALDTYADLLAHGIAAGVVTLTDPAADAASEAP